MKVFWNSGSNQIFKMYQLYMEELKPIKNVAVLPNTIGPGSWEISHWLDTWDICELGDHNGLVLFARTPFVKEKKLKTEPL